MANPIDWEQLARQLGLLHPDGESSGSGAAQQALELLLGEDRLRAAVDYYISGGPGSELARNVLWMLHPWSAMQYCYEIYRSDADVDTRRSAVELLRVVADRRALPWVQEFLNDPDPGIQSWGAGVLDQMLFAHLVWPEDCADLLQKITEHPNEQVRKTATFIQEYLQQSEATDAGAARREREEP
jgi:HEAT repeat protein